VRKLGQLKKIVNPTSNLKELFIQLLMLLSEIDSSIEIGSNPRLLISRTWEFA